ncbi:MAG: diaminopimelate epimerase [Alcanivoracaceae bacterium]|jgi:diaminopimelate epimerase|nr:diaminopimelate epimerase [Alcanivoracaceae bacterium]
MSLQFSKMHGLGNDFMVIDGIRQNLPASGLPLPRERIRALADRHFGVGFDQLLVVQPASTADVDFRYRIFNADGSEVNQCGNGARCFARFVRDQGLTDKDSIRVETASGQMTLSLTADGQVTVDMGAPRWAPKDIPLNASEEADSYFIVAGKQAFEVGAVGLGNPHCVLLVENVDSAPVASVGPLLESHPNFPERVNVGFMQIVDRGHIRLRVFERGSGETLACGSGACAAAVVGQRRGFLDDCVQVDLPGGSLSIQYSGEKGILMTGPAAHVYDGRIEI